MSDWRIPLSDLNFGPEEEAALLRVLHSRWLSMGPEVQRFEQEFATFIGVKHAFAVANGTAALHLAYLALGLGTGDEIIQPAINFVAAANMTAAVGARPVFADILALDEPTIDPGDLEKRLTPRTKALVVMHYGGYLCRMAELVDFCRRHGLSLIEDACHAVGTGYVEATGRAPNGLKAGAIGDVAAFSFFSNKNLATGEGGMITTNRDDLASRIRLLRSHGMTTLTWDRHKGHASAYDAVLHGYNYRFNELGAALGRCQLARLESGNQRRGEWVRLYRKGLASLRDWIIPFAAYSGESAYHLMVVVAPSEAARTEMVKRLNAARIQTSRHYPCLPSLSSLKPFRTPGLDRSDAFAQRIITLPLFPTMTSAQIHEICDAMVAG